LLTWLRQSSIIRLIQVSIVFNCIGNDFEDIKKQVEAQITKSKDTLMTKYDELKYETSENRENLRKDNKRQYEHLKEDMTDLNIKLDNIPKEKTLESSLVERIVKLEVTADTTKEDIKRVRDR
jgi:hypothetical protein